MSEAIHIRRQLRDRPEFKKMPTPLSCKANTPVAEAVKEMCERGFGCIVVVDDDQHVIGIMTERDLMTRVINPGKDLKTTPVGDIMTRDPHVAHESDTVVDCMRMMSNKRFRRLPLVDDDERLEMVFTQGDFVSYTWPDLLHDMAESTKESVTRNYPLWMLAGGIAAYALVMSVLVIILAL